MEVGNYFSQTSQYCPCCRQLLHICPRFYLFQIQNYYCIFSGFWFGWYFVSLWEDWKGVSRMERKKELILPYLVEWNSLCTCSFILDSSINSIVNLKYLAFHFTFQLALVPNTCKMFVFLQHMFHFLHLQENLVYITCNQVISPDLIYHITKGFYQKYLSVWQ